MKKFNQENNIKRKKRHSSMILFSNRTMKAYGFQAQNFEKSLIFMVSQKKSLKTSLKSCLLNFFEKLNQRQLYAPFVLCSFSNSTLKKNLMNGNSQRKKLDLPSSITILTNSISFSSSSMIQFEFDYLYATFYLFKFCLIIFETIYKCQRENAVYI